MSSHLHNVELYLETAPPLYYIDPPPGGGGHPGKFGVVLEGGFHLLVKPSDTVDRGERVVKNEAAAWQAAKLMGCSYLMSMTIVRPFTSWQTGTLGVLSSAQVIWPAVMPGPSFADIREIQRAWIAAFDYVTHCTDRGKGQHNWLAVRCSRTGDIQIKLFDNGFSWDFRDGESEFVSDMRGQSLAEEILSGVRALNVGASAGPLASLLDDSQLENLSTRCGLILADGKIP